MTLFLSIVTALISFKFLFGSFMGAFMLYLVNRQQGKQPLSLFRALNINVSDKNARPYVILLDMIISSILGAIMVVLATAPTTLPQAVFAGLGMTGILTFHVKEIGS